ncbi:MAG: hypothetical protein ABWJ42_02080 [Sulfolobales archaeon]
MRVRFVDARVWRYSIAALEDLVETAVMSVNENGLMIRAMDPGHVAMIEFNIPREGFDIFDVDKEYKIPLDLETLIKILRRASKKDETLLEYQPPNIRLGLVSPEGVERFYEFTALAQGVAEEPPELSIEFPVRASVVPQAFRSSYKVLSEVGEAFEIISDQSKMIFYSSSELGEVRIELTQESGLLRDYEFKAESEQRAKYSLDYFDKIAKLAMISEDIEIYHGDSLPVKLVASLPRGARLTLYVAPREE